LKKNIIIIILIGIIISVIIFFFFFNNSFHKNDNADFINQIGKLKQERDDALKKKIVTTTVFKTLPDVEKDKAYQNALEIIENDTKLLEKKDNQLIEFNKNQKKLQRNILIQGFASSGFNQNFNLKFQEGILISKIFNWDKLVHFSYLIGGGGSVDQVYNFNLNQTIVGGNLIFITGFMF
jgi:hypothetical protein